jgi:hypothetical protein
MGVIQGRKTAQFQGSLVVFVIGARINRFHRIDKWLPVLRAMGPMIAELAADPESGFLGAETMLAGVRQVCLIQYWRDFDSLERYARDRDRKHWPSWTRFNKAIGADGTVGIFHETYCVPAGGHESIYANMPEWGLGRVAGITDATGARKQARERLKASTA